MTGRRVFVGLMLACLVACLASAPAAFVVGSSSPSQQALAPENAAALQALYDAYAAAAAGAPIESSSDDKAEPEYNAEGVPVPIANKMRFAEASADDTKKSSEEEKKKKDTAASDLQQVHVHVNVAAPAPKNSNAGLAALLARVTKKNQEATAKMEAILRKLQSQDCRGSDCLPQKDDKMQQWMVDWVAETQETGAIVD